MSAVGRLKNSRKGIFLYYIQQANANRAAYVFENLNGICSHVKGVDKGKYLSLILNKLEVDCFGSTETSLHWK